VNGSYGYETEEAEGGDEGYGKDWTILCGSKCCRQDNNNNNTMIVTLQVIPKDS